MSGKSERQGTQRGRRARLCRRDSGLCAFSDPFFQSGGTTSTQAEQPQNMRRARGCVAMANVREKAERVEGLSAVAMAAEQGAREKGPRGTHVYSDSSMLSLMSSALGPFGGQWRDGNPPTGVGPLAVRGASSARDQHSPQSLCKQTTRLEAPNKAACQSKTAFLSRRDLRFNQTPPQPANPCPVPHTPPHNRKEH